jgi:hypothetical protein
MSIMVDWNVLLKVGLVGLSATILFAAWFVARAAGHKAVPRPWLLGLGLLFLVSTFTTVGSQITVVSRLSSGGPEDETGE